MINRPPAEPPDPTPARPTAVAALLGELRAGRRDALDRLVPLVYDELHELAHRRRRAWRGDHTLDTTALVHEAYLKLVDQRRASWETEAHFLAAASQAIRHILINYARDRRTQKRGGGWQRVSLSRAVDAASAGTDTPWEDRVVALEDALTRLALRSPRQCRIVECRFFGGMTVEQTAQALDLSTATVVRSWAVARAWLHRELSGGAA